MRCERCSSEGAAHTYILYDPHRYRHMELRLCGTCYEGYTPSVKRSGEVVWKRVRPVSFHPPALILISSTRITKAVIPFIDWLARSRLVAAFYRYAPHILAALAAASTAILAYSLAWYLLNMDKLEVVRSFYRSYPLAGIGIPSIDPVFPALELLAAIPVTMAIHELGHAVVLRRYGQEVRRVGLIFLGPIPVGAFVEPAGSVEHRMGAREVAELAGAGIITNMLAAAASLGGVFILLSGFRPQGLEALAALARLYDNPPLLLFPPIILAYLGVYTPSTAPAWWFTHPLGPAAPLLLSMLHHIFLLNFWAAVFNAFPAKPLDGGLALYAALRDRMSPRGLSRIQAATTVALAAAITIPLVILRF